MGRVIEYPGKAEVPEGSDVSPRERLAQAPDSLFGLGPSGSLDIPDSILRQPGLAILLDPDCRRLYREQEEYRREHCGLGNEERTPVRQLMEALEVALEYHQPIEQTLAEVERLIRISWPYIHPALHERRDSPDAS